MAMLIFDPFNRFFWGLAIFLIFLNTLLIFLRGAKDHQKDQKKTFFGVGFLILGLGLSRLFFFISDYLRNGFYIGHQYFAQDGGSAFLFNLFGRLATMQFLLGSLGFYFFLSKCYKRYFMVPFFINASFIILLTFTSDLYETITTYLTFGFNAIFILIILLWVTHNSTKEVQVFTLFILTSSTLYIIGSIFDSGLFKELQLFSPTTPAFFIIISMILSILSLEYKPTNLAKFKFFVILIYSILIFSLGFTITVSILVFLKTSEHIILILSIWIAFLFSAIIFLYLLFRLKITLDILYGKKPISLENNSLDMLSKFLYYSKSGTVQILSENDVNLLNSLNEFIWDEHEKEEFSSYLFSLPPNQREEIINKMKNQRNEDEV